tara:strand:+ start:624 stop:917 length:294 start_codon:yes stop_codon:yes gene_type:complete
MIKKFLAVGIITIALTSCGTAGIEKFDSAATEICECMSNAPALSEELIAMGLTRDADFSNCIKDIDAAMISNEQMAKSIETVCPDLAELHAEYAKEL